MVKKLFIRIWKLIELGVTRWIEYTFRKRNTFQAPLILVTGQLMLELGELAAKDYLDPIYKFVTEEYGKVQGIILELFGDLITGNYVTGFSYLSISIKLFLIILFSFLAFSKESGIKITWQWFWGWNWKFKFLSDNTLINFGSDFKITDQWFEDINGTDRLNKNKYISKLHVESQLERNLFNQIVNEHVIVAEYEESLGVSKNAIGKLKAEVDYLNILIEDRNDPLILNTNSEFHEEFQKVIRQIELIELKLEKIGSLAKVRANPGVSIKEIEFPISSSELSDKINYYLFDLIKIKIRLSTGIKTRIRRRIFNAFLPILLSIKRFNETIRYFEKKRSEILRNHYIVHSSAGIGKTYFAANIFHSLQEKGFSPIFLKGSTFSGSHSNLAHAFQKVFKYPEEISIKSFFSQLNEYGKKKGKRVVLIVDGLNETTYNLSAFSPIWTDGIENLTEDIFEFEYISFLATCRTSYIENHIDPNFSLQCSHRLSGFEDFEIRKKAVKEYFDYYKIESNTVNSRNSRLFSIPLILKIYCVAKNGSRTNSTKVELNYNSYEETLLRFVEAESIEVANKLDRPSATPIFNGIKRTSERFVQEVSASLDYDEFIALCQGTSIDFVLKSTSIGSKFLETELLFMKDVQPYFKGERVVHTFQNVGGYLSSQFLYARYETPSQFVTSNEYTSLLKGSKRDRITGGVNENIHQLASDILLFMVYQYSKNNDLNYRNDLIDHSQDPQVLFYSWRFVNDFIGTNASLRLEQKLKNLGANINLWDGLFDQNIDEYVDHEFPFNFEYVRTFLLSIESSYVELTWVKNIYERYRFFDEFLNIPPSHFNNKQFEYALEMTIWLLESTSHNLRDTATKKILEYGETNPKVILSKVNEYATGGRTYIYERLVSIMYGICLRKQNDPEFLEKELKECALFAYKIQFSETPIAPSYHYVVIDSLRHIIDLAISKRVFKIDNEDEKLKIEKYKFNPLEEWIEIDQDDKDKVSEITSNWHHHKPDPFRGDFVHYTIPRLISEGNVTSLEAAANIYKRLLDSGYEPKIYGDMPEGIEREFYFGSNRHGIIGKIDRLGKKYSWNAYWEYAGNLLNRGILPVWNEGDSSVFDHYDRMSDVELEVSFTTEKFVNAELFTDDLLGHRSEDNNWTTVEKYAVTKQIWETEFLEENYVLMNGYLEAKLDESYNVRSFLMIETFLVTKADLEGKEPDLVERTMDWRHDLYSGGSISKAYFGELYWADTIPLVKRNRESIPSTETMVIDETLETPGMSFIEKFHAREGDKNKVVNVNIGFEVEPGVVEYAWESGSEVYPSIRDYVPSPNIGKQLKLKSDPNNFQILDEEGKPAFKSVRYEGEKKIKQNLSYLRKDLLNKYLEDNGLVLLYQIKQETYDRMTGDGTGHYTGMQFFFPHLGE